MNVAEVVLAKVAFDAGDFGFGLLSPPPGSGSSLGSLGAALRHRALR